MLPLQDDHDIENFSNESRIKQPKGKYPAFAPLSAFYDGGGKAVRSKGWSELWKLAGESKIGWIKWWLRIRLLTWDNNLMRYIRDKWPSGGTFFLGLACLVLGIPGIFGLSLLAFAGATVAAPAIVIAGIAIYFILAALEVGNLLLKTYHWIKELAELITNWKEWKKSPGKIVARILSLFTGVGGPLASICAGVGSTLVGVAMILSIVPGGQVAVPAVMAAVPFLFMTAFALSAIAAVGKAVDLLTNDTDLAVAWDKVRHPSKYDLTKAPVWNLINTFLLKLSPHFLTAMIGVAGIGVVATALTQFFAIAPMVKNIILTVAGSVFSTLGVTGAFSTPDYVKAHEDDIKIKENKLFDTESISTDSLDEHTSLLSKKHKSKKWNKEKISDEDLVDTMRKRGLFKGFELTDGAKEILGRRLQSINQ